MRVIGLGEREINDDEWKMISMCQDVFKKEREEFVEKCKNGELQYSDVTDYFSKHGIMQEIEDAKEKYSSEQLDIYSSRKELYGEFILKFARFCTKGKEISKKCFDFFSDDYLKQLNITRDELIKTFEDNYYESCEEYLLDGATYVNRNGQESVMLQPFMERYIFHKVLDLSYSKNENNKMSYAVMSKFRKNFETEKSH